MTVDNKSGLRDQARSVSSPFTARSFEKVGGHPTRSGFADDSDRQDHRPKSSSPPEASFYRYGGRSFYHEVEPEKYLKHEDMRG